MFKRYFDYLRDNPHGYWFKRRLYGFGWVPVTWQGWLAVALYVAGMTVISVRQDSGALTASETLIGFVIPAIAMTAGLLAIALWKGERPRWQWGIPREDNRGR